jgi:hypothetical protein
MTYANVMATVAVFLALGGGAWAVSTAAKDSVTTRSIRDGAVTGKKIDRGAITGKHVSADALKGKDIDEGSLRLPAGFDPGEISPHTAQQTLPSVAAGETFGPLVASCPDGQVAVSGGADIDQTGVVTSSNEPGGGSPPSSWQVIFYNAGSAISGPTQFTTIVLCAPGS